MSTAGVMPISTTGPTINDATVSAAPTKARLMFRRRAAATGATVRRSAPHTSATTRDASASSRTDTRDEATDPASKATSRGMSLPSRRRTKSDEASAASKGATPRSAQPADSAADAATSKGRSLSNSRARRGNGDSSEGTSRSGSVSSEREKRAASVSSRDASPPSVATFSSKASTTVSNADSDTPVKSNSTSYKTRNRSVSPHARQILQRANFRSSSSSRAQSRSRSRGNPEKKDESGEIERPLLVAVTSCRSDAYHSQKGPTATSKLPRKAPSALRAFHELAIGVKDAYEAIGATPKRPEEQENSENLAETDPLEREGQVVLWEFMGNLDFLLAIVDEVAVDTATRGALKDDTTFKSLRDVIKKCNKVLESMLVRRERKYTLFFRLVQPRDVKEIKKMNSWNMKVEKAIGAVAEGKATTPGPPEIVSDTASDTASEASSAVSSRSGSGSAIRGGGMFSRGRSMLPTAGRVRARRATPTPSLRNRHRPPSETPSSGVVAAEDGFSAITAPVTPGNLAKLQQTLSQGAPGSSNAVPPALQKSNAAPTLSQTLNGDPTMQPKDELVDVIRGLRVEKQMQAKEGFAGNSAADLKPNWIPKADIPTAVPKLPTEYIHRHRLMKQVVNCLLGGGPRDTDEETTHSSTFITSITSRHADKAGNGKTTLAVAAIQTVEVRERFCDGIAWIKLGRTALTEKDIRRLYEELHSQLLRGSSNDDSDDELESVETSNVNDIGAGSGSSRTSSLGSLDKEENDKDSISAVNSVAALELAKSRRRFQGGELEGIKEDLGRILSKKKVLICLDDVWRVEDAKWFIFDSRLHDSTPNMTDEQMATHEDTYPLRILMTTRLPALLGTGVAQEVFVRILSEHEAVKLLLSSAGRRVAGGKNSPVFHQARVIVKGCGNSPLAIRLAGGLLRNSNRNWTLSSKTWISLLSQCRSSLEEASTIRSFVNSVGRIIDLSVVSIEALDVRTALRRCFVSFAMVFGSNEWLQIGKGIPRTVLVELFKTVLSVSVGGNGVKDDGLMGKMYSSAVSPEALLETLENLNLLQRARHGCRSRAKLATEQEDGSDDDDDEDSDQEGASAPATSLMEAASPSLSESPSVEEGPCYLMHDSVKAIGEEMSSRDTPGYCPVADEFTAFSSELDEEAKRTKSLSSGLAWSAPLRSAAKYIAQLTRSERWDGGLHDHQFHEMVVSSLTGIGVGNDLRIMNSSSKSNIASEMKQPSDSMVEKYIATHLPMHLIRSKMLGSAGDVLSNEDYVGRRVAALGPVEATRRQVADLLDLRREVSKVMSGGRAGTTGQTSSEDKTGGRNSPAEQNDIPEQKSFEENSPNNREGSGPEASPSDGHIDPSSVSVDINAVQRDGSRLIIDEVYRRGDVANSSTDSLNMAICLSTVGEGLLKSRQPRDAMLRLEEAVGIYRGLLGPFHVEVARALNCVAKALVKLGETRVALLKFGEAARIYEACNAGKHYDAISNAQSLASLLVAVGDWTSAAAKYREVIAVRRLVYGKYSVPVAKTINDYAVVLAKHGRMDDALTQYEQAKETFDHVAATSFSPMNVADLVKCKSDVTLINLNIASIKSKKGDVDGAIASYEAGVIGLKEFLKYQQEHGAVGGEVTKSTSHRRHLVSAMSRLGSLKLKQGDNDGALEAYEALLSEVDDGSPTTSRIEKAKAFVKCATIYRQRESTMDQEKAISHLSSALEMYTELHGPNHKDTIAIASSLRQWQAQETSNGHHGSGV